MPNQQVEVVLNPRPRLQQVNGGARYVLSDNTFQLIQDIDLVNRTNQRVGVNPVVVLRTTDKNGNQLYVENIRLASSTIVLPPNSTRSWQFTTTGNFPRLKDCEIITVSIQITLVDPPSTVPSLISDSLTWKAKECVCINIIYVSREDYTAVDLQEVQDGIRITKQIYEQVDFTICDVNYYRISRADAGNHRVIDSSSEARQLTQDWTVQNDCLDVFVVRSMVGADGWSPVGGPCDKDAKGMNGVVVSLNGGSANVGNTFAHEIGHYLGLNHIADPNNFIGNNGASNSNTAIEVWQQKEMKKHCAVKYSRC